MDSKPTRTAWPVLEPIPSRGAFDSWCIKLNRTATEIARHLGVKDPAMIGQYRRGDVRPGYDMMVRIFEASCGEVPLDSWATRTAA